MKYIEKHCEAQEVVAYGEELKRNRLDKDSLADGSVHPNMKGADVYEAISSFDTIKSLKDRMYADQGGICCYCGCRLSHPGLHQCVVEHVFPKEQDRTLAGEYENLLLSCRPSAEEEKQRMEAPKKERKMFFHCDKAKESKIISHTPLQKDCHKFFAYDEFGGISGLDEAAEKDIEILNLNCEWLRTRRAAAIEGEIYDENGELLEDEELRSRLNTIMQPGKDGMYAAFCFAVQNAIIGFLSDTPLK